MDIYNIRRLILKTLFKTLFISCLVLSLNLFAAEIININTADAISLAETIKGVGKKKAEAIVDYREANGNFKSISELTNVKGINTGILEANKDVLSVNDN